MKKLIRRAHIFLAAAMLGAVASISSVVLHTTEEMLLAPMLLSVTLSFTLLFWNTTRSIMTARLIIENQILHIQPAVIHDRIINKKKASPLINESIEVFVSCFGILFDYRIIKFNQDGVQLKTVELGRDFIALTYGTEQKTQSTKLLHEAIGEDELVRIAQKFRYETGVIPILNK